MIIDLRNEIGIIGGKNEFIIVIKGNFHGPFTFDMEDQVKDWIKQQVVYKHAVSTIVPAQPARID